MLYAGGWLRDDGTFRRVEGLGELARILDHALSQGTPAASIIQDRLVAQWPKARDSLLLAIERRTDERFRSLQAKLATRQEDERRQITTSFERFAATLRKALAESQAEEGALFSVAEGRGDTRRWPSSAGTARNGKKNSAAWTPPVTTSSSASAPATGTSGGTASPSR